MKSIFSLALMGLALSSCSLGHSASDDLKLSNPTVALQAQKVVDLKQQVDAQKQVVKTQKDAADTEKKKLDGLEDQLKGAQQNLKGVKTQAKA